MSNLVYARFVDEAALTLPYLFAHHVDSDTPLETTANALKKFHIISNLLDKTILLHNGSSYVYVGEDEEEVGFVVYIAAPSARECKEIWEILEPLFPEPLPKTDEISINFWSTRHGNAHKRTRQLIAPDWPEIAPNYSQPARDAVSRLVDLTPDDLEINGRLELFHGLTGAGKTFAVKSKAKAWSKWCNLHYILDPQTLFSNPEYMLSVIMNEDESIIGSSKKPAKLWNLMIMEDSDKFIQTDAKQEVGQQAFSNLLNLSQGMIGQGLNWVILITTNEPLQHINPAILRDMRCLAEVEFGPLSPKEVKEWCKIHNIANIPSGEKSLAQLYSLLTTTGGKIVSHTAKKSMQMGSF